MHFNNPHPQFGIPQTQQQTPMSQQQLMMMNQQLQQQLQQLQQMQQMQQMQQPNPNGMVGMGMNPQQLAMMQQMMRQQGQLQMQNNPPTPTGGRFGDGGGVQQGLLGGNTPQQFTPQQQFSPEPDSRYGKGELVEPVVEVSKFINFTVNPEAVYFYGNDKIKITPKVKPFKNTPLLTNTKTITYSYSVEEAVDCIHDKVKNSENDNPPPLTVQKFVVVDDTFDAGKNFTLTTVKKLFEEDIRTTYRRLKAAFQEATDVPTLTGLERIDRIITAYVNKTLFVGFEEPISVDSFVEDFNDLLKLIRNTYDDDEEDVILNQLDKVVKCIREGYEADEINVLSLPETCVLAHYNTHHYALGLKGITGIVRLTDSETNYFLKWITDCILDSVAVEFEDVITTFYLTTQDHALFEFTKNSSDEYFVTRLN